MKHIISILLALSVGACAFTPIDLVTSAGMWVLDSTVEGQTGKGVVDNAVSSVVGRDCKLKNMFNKNEEVCKDEEEEEDASKK